MGVANRSAPIFRAYLLEQTGKIHVHARAAHFVEEDVFAMAISKPVMRGIYR
jgi:hypothetical protein